MWTRCRRVVVSAALVPVLALLPACGGSSPSTGTTEPVTPPGAEEQPVVWPAAEVGFASPEAAAADFVTHALGVPATLGPFQAGDPRSGEIELRFAGEGAGAPTVPRGTLLMRRLGDEATWFVLGAANDNAAITAPEAEATVPAGPLTVTGRARGFEGAVSVTTFLAGHADLEFDRAFTTAGSLATPKPFRVRLDLSAARPGDTVVILVRGGVGHELDPGDIGAIAVRIR